MSMFMAAMRQELREKGRINGFGGMSSGAWASEVREYEEKLADQRTRDGFGMGSRTEPKKR